MKNSFDQRSSQCPIRDHAILSEHLVMSYMSYIGTLNRVDVKDPLVSRSGRAPTGTQFGDDIMCD